MNHIRINHIAAIKKILLLVFLFTTSLIHAAKVDTILVHSTAMNKDIKVLVVVPQTKGPHSVTYLLHGYGGDEKTWLTIRPDLAQLSDQYQMMFVCPNCESSWYWDSPKVPTIRYETFTSKELVEYIDKKYDTRATKQGRAITGLSMGGHGSMWLALRHADVYGAAGTTSGGVDIRPFPHDGVMKDLLGQEAENQEIWNQYVAINQIERIKNGDLALIVDCGYDDFFFEVNSDFHKKLLKYSIDHDFIVRPGAHTPDYWNNAIDYQLLFFKKYFDKKNH
ncbi:alpha/beta hydrolase family protein [Bacteroides sp.]|uniref:alpha/beta hydrolase n=1 Tax=Bacteroides sp. TaxID=29523 RepID=UPI002FC62292